MTKVIQVTITVVTEEDGERTVDVVANGKLLEPQDSGLPYDSSQVYHLVEEQDWGLDVTYVPSF